MNLPRFYFLTLLILFPGNESLSTVIGVIGDYGSDDTNELAVAALVKSWSPDFIVTVGDNNYVGDYDRAVGKYYHEFIGNYRGRFGSGASSNRFFPVLGNHDFKWAGGADYLDFFTLPGVERYYAVRCGPVEIFALDSENEEVDGNSSTSIQAEWLREQLLASDAPWKIVCFHTPPYTFGSRWQGKEKMRWPFKEWGASAVLTGHNHVYERFFTNGLTYCVNGLGGAEIYKAKANLNHLARFDNDYGAMRIEANETNICFQFFTQSRLMIDSFSMTRGLPFLAGQPQSRTAIVGETVTFSVVASGQGTLHYQWHKNGISLPGATNSLLTLPDVSFHQEGSYLATVADELGSVNSDVATLTLSCHPRIVQQPFSQAWHIDDIAKLEVVAEGYGPLRYQWRFNGKNLQDATNRCLDITNRLEYEGTYSVAVSDALGTIESDPATLAVLRHPRILQQPISQYQFIGNNVNLEVLAKGYGLLRLQWQSNGTNIANATNASLTVRAIGTNQLYRVVVSDDLGSTISQVARVFTLAAAPNTMMGWAFRNVARIIAYGAMLSLAVYVVLQGYARFRRVAIYVSQSVPRSVGVSKTADSEERKNSLVTIELPYQNAENKQVFPPEIRRLRSRLAWTRVIPPLIDSLVIQSSTRVVARRTTSRLTIQYHLIKRDERWIILGKTKMARLSQKLS